MHIDEHLLAGYIAGELNEKDRASVTSELVRDHSLREWLHMATAALASAKDDCQQGPHMRLLAALKPAKPGFMRADRRSMPSMAHVRRAI